MGVREHPLWALYVMIMSRNVKIEDVGIQGIATDESGVVAWDQLMGGFMAFVEQVSSAGLVNGSIAWQLGPSGEMWARRDC